MKRKINRIAIVCMLIGFFASPSLLKSQTFQLMSSMSCLIKPDSQCNFNNRFSLNHFFDSDWVPNKGETFKADSLKKVLEIAPKLKSFNNSIIPKSKRNSLTKTRQMNFRNMPVLIQTRI